MVSEYDVFQVIASKGELRIIDIVKALNKPTSDYQHIFNLVSSLNNKGFVARKNTVKVIHNEQSEKLFRLISFCMNNCINYNLIFKKNMVEFIQKAAKKELFTIKDIRIHPQTFNLYVEALSKYGFLLVISRKPLKCKLLRHHFFTELMKFFKRKIFFYTTHRHSFLNAIKREIKKYKKNLKINPTRIDDLSNKGKVSFIHTSLNMEGNPLTLPETQKLLLEDIVPEKYKLTQIKEVTDYKKAIDLMIENVKKRLS
ncbi:hypothetical protein HY837_04995 [archaeon]|nr:hypothetical protein [archaeon]